MNRVMMIAQTAMAADRRAYATKNRSPSFQVDRWFGSGLAADRELDDPVEDPQPLVLGNVLMGLRSQNAEQQEVGWFIRRGRE